MWGGALVLVAMSAEPGDFKTPTPVSNPTQPADDCKSAPRASTAVEKKRLQDWTEAARRERERREGIEKGFKDRGLT